MFNTVNQTDPLTMKSESLGGAGGVIPLNEIHVRNCKFAANRSEILPMLPSEGKMAYLGMSDISYAAEIAKKTNPKEMHIVSKPYSAEELIPIRTSLQSNSLFFSNGKDVMSYLVDTPDNYFDWFYFEKPISYKMVKKIIAVAEKKVKPNGIFVFRNYIFWMKNRKQCGVVPAVNEFIVNNNWEMIIYAFQKKGFADIAITKSSTAN